ncbi:unnamed protein product [Ambrosiozyma monospora]|uniref:Unnamed protein product n=1 Tax=Ambrosiozyma monospora TaxID=43982 RepID=A0A9W6YTN6_AMBMO|nr:unnamed protein product [Ambrosiozyma monospora]
MASKKFLSDEKVVDSDSDSEVEQQQQQQEKQPKENQQKNLLDQLLEDKQAELDDRDEDEPSSSSDEEEYVYEPPRHFNLVTKGKPLDQLKKKHFGKKELWLIKVPKDLDVKHLKNLPVNLHIQQSTTFDLDGKSYKVHEEITPASTTADSKESSERYALITPEKSRPGISKKLEHLKFSRFYNVSENVVIPEINYGKVVTQRQDVEKEEGLRMRHFPTGYYKKDYKEAEVQETNDSNKKRKREDLSVDEMINDSIAEEGKKKHKKDKKSKKEKKDKKKKKHHHSHDE